MRLIVVLLEPVYDENLGLTVRAMKNFGFSELILVNPIADKNSSGAKSRAMHAQDVLKKAKIVKSLEIALKKVDFSVATTSITTKAIKCYRNALTPKQLAENYVKTDLTLAIVFGREPTGLTSEEVNKCDFIVSIPTHYKYKSMNLSHAVSVILYELSIYGKNKKFKTVDKKLKNQLLKKFNSIVDLTPKINKPSPVKTAFKSVISRSPITSKETNSLLALFSYLNEIISKKPKQ